METGMDNRQLNTTLRAGAWSGRATIPVVDGVDLLDTEHAESGIPYGAGDVIGGCSLTKLLCVRANCRLFLGENSRQESVVVKIYEPGTARTTMALRKLNDSLRRKGCPSLMPLIAFGDLEGDIHYEVMPVYQQGTLEGAVLTEDDLIGHILPQLNEALLFLGDFHLVHNDIKPSNLFWKDKASKEIVLGDYDCLTTDNSRDKAGGTPLFMAPERIFTQGKIHTNISDYCSMGLTLIALLLGRPHLENGFNSKDKGPKVVWRYISRCWQGGMEKTGCPIDLNISVKTRALLNCMVQPDKETRKRYCGEYITEWIKTDGHGGVNPLRAHREQVQTVGLRYRNKLILDIPELIKEQENDWEYAVFMLKEHQLDDFVRQFDGRFYEYCQKYAEIDNHSAGLFKLMQSLMPSTRICWLGERFDSLEDFVNRTEKEERYNLMDPFSLFCRACLLSFYLQQAGANEEQIERAREIEKIGKTDPELAVKKLQISLQQKPDFIWHGTTLRSLEDLLAYLENCKEKLDMEVADLYASGAFKVWLDYIQHGNILSAVEKKIMESGI